MLANSFIGDLGTKYKKINHRFTCRDCETAMNISVHNYNDLYLIKEQKIERLISETCSINRFVSEATVYYMF